MKIDYDKARMQLIDYKLDDLIAEYGKLKELRNEIQEKFFSVIESIKENELDDVDINTHEWQKIRDSENTNWDGELDIISEYKHQVNEYLELLYDGTIEQMYMIICHVFNSLPILLFHIPLLIYHILQR